MKVQRRGFLQALGLFGGAAAAGVPVETVNVAPVGSVPASVEVIARNVVPGALRFPSPMAADYSYAVTRALYDVIRVPAGSMMPREWSFFSAPVGFQAPHPSYVNAEWQVKTVADTNMWAPSYLPPPAEQLVQRILFVIAPPASRSDVEALLSDYYFQFQLLERIMVCAPMSRCTSIGAPLKILMRRPTGERRGGPTAVVPSWMLSLELQVPIHLLSLAHFALRLYGVRSFATAAPFALWAYLDGLGSTPVQ